MPILDILGSVDAHKLEYQSIIMDILRDRHPDSPEAPWAYVMRELAERLERTADDRIDLVYWLGAMVCAAESASEGYQRKIKALELKLKEQGR